MFYLLTLTYTNTPVNNTWYNNNSIVLSVPIGLWELGYACFARSRIAHSTTPYIDTFVTLSTTNNSETLPQYTVLRTSYFGGLGNGRMNKSTCQETVKRIEEKIYQHEKEISGLKQVYKSIQDLAISINNLTSETKYIRQDLFILNEE